MDKFLGVLIIFDAKMLGLSILINIQPLLGKQICVAINFMCSSRKV